MLCLRCDAREELLDSAGCRRCHKQTTFLARCQVTPCFRLDASSLPLWSLVLGLAVGSRFSAQFILYFASSGQQQVPSPWVAVAAPRPPQTAGVVAGGCSSLASCS